MDPLHELLEGIEAENILSTDKTERRNCTEKLGTAMQRIYSQMFSELKDNKSVPRELLLKGFDVDQIWGQIAILQKEYAKIYKPKLKAFKELDDKMEKDFEEEMNAKEELESSIPISKKRKLDEDSIENSENESNGSEDEDEDEDDGGIDIHGELDDEEKKLEKALDDYEAGVAKDDASNEEEFNEDEDEEDKDDAKEKSEDTPSKAHPKELAKDADDLDMEEVEKMADELEAIPDDSLDGLNDDEDEDDDQDIDTLIKKSKKLKDNDIMYNDFFEEDKKGDDDSGDEDIGLHGKSDDEEEKDLDKALDDYEAGIAEDDATHEDEEEDLDNEEGVMDEDEDKEDEEPEAAPTPEAITAFKKSEIEIHRRIAELEERLVGDQHWSMIGEVSGAERPENSLLETGLEYDAAVSAPPTITEEATKSLEDIIIKRIKDGVFDDVVKKEPPKPMKEKKTIVLNDEKSKEGLADLYARDYQEQLTGVKQEDDKLDKNKKEIMKLFNKITHDLDVLSNFHYVPKLPEETPTVLRHTAALSREEAVPLAVSAADRLAPEEIYARKKESELKSKDETTQQERKKRRRDNKRIKQKEKKQFEHDMKLLEKSNPAMGNKYAKEKLAAQLKSLQKSGAIKTVDNTKDKESFKSSAFFSKISSAKDESRRTAKAKAMRDISNNAGADNKSAKSVKL